VFRDASNDMMQIRLWSVSLIYTGAGSSFTNQRHSIRTALTLMRNVVGELKSLRALSPLRITSNASA
jgi:hypothetical protein